MRTPLFIALALTGFAANSLLCRAALGAGRIDAATFTAVRIASGAAVLFLLATRAGGARNGSWGSAAALFAYAAAFSFAYRSLPAGAGALVLFGAVQITMFGAGIARGERPAPAVWGGAGLALGGLAWLALPGARDVSPIGAALMLAAGVAWGIYSLRGRRAGPPLPSTADNFIRAAPMAAALWLATARDSHATPGGVALAAASGAIASGLGYSLWYAALPHLTAARAAVLQLAVPVLAAGGGVALLGETITLRLVTAAAAILSGVALAVWPRHSARSADAGSTRAARSPGTTAASAATASNATETDK